MSIRTETFIHCDGRTPGSSWSCGACCIAPNLDLALDMARKRGWEITGTGAFFCPDHRIDREEPR